MTRKPGFRNTFVLKFELVYLPEKFFVARGVRHEIVGKVYSVSHLCNPLIYANVLTDLESRVFLDQAVWKLDPQVIQVSQCKTDLLSTRLTRQLKKNISWRPDPEACNTTLRQCVLARVEGICVPSLQPDTSNSQESSDRPYRDCSDCPSLAG